MRSLFSAAVAGASFATAAAAAAAAAAALEPSVSPSYLKMYFNKLYGDSFANASKWNEPKARIVKRDNGYEDIEIINQQSFFSISLEIGTPSQNVTVLLDTGSSDLWITGSDNPLCGTEINCDEYGTFDSSASSTFRSNNTAFSISYADYSFASGSWAQDVLFLSDGNLNITGLSFAVANYTNSTVGVLGVGLPGGETTYSGSGSLSSKPYQYANFPIVLKNSGAISHTAYSLYLNKLTEESGNILFGAVDHSKYTGPLYTLPLVNTLQSKGYNNPIQFDITLQGLGLSNDTANSTITDTQIPVLLDSGTTLTYLPLSLSELLAAELGAQYSARLGYYIMQCPSDDDDTKIVFDFGGFHINTNLTNFIITSSGGVCVLGLVPQTSQTAILGDLFLTHAYVVYDLENYEISLAQATYDEDADEDIEIISGSVPSAQPAPGYSSTWSTYQSITSGGNIFTVTNEAASVTGGPSSTTSKGSSSSTGPRSSSGTRRSSTVSTSLSSSTSTTSSSTSKTEKANVGLHLTPSLFTLLISFGTAFLA